VVGYFVEIILLVEVILDFRLRGNDGGGGNDGWRWCGWCFDFGEDYCFGEVWGNRLRLAAGYWLVWWFILIGEYYEWLLW